MDEYQVIARKYRPQRFQDVLGQEAILVTLLNAIRFNRVAHAYLFSGSRGCGKTTIARLFAKALNCSQLSESLEPCNTCPSCKDIISGAAMDFIEIDGASNRGIDDIRKINETVGYSPANGKYKIYLIDEVHMLTKEAFNALLKTLEEPPPSVKFFFATTELHKVPSTILSRCQRFQLNRISTEKIAHKLRQIASDLKIKASEEALLGIAKAADGSLRDAESLFDQIISFKGSPVTAEAVYDVLGLVTQDCFFALDEAFANGNFAIAFELSNQVITSGKDIPHFVEGLIEHYRHILLFHLGDISSTFITLSEQLKLQYQASAKQYTKEQCLAILDLIIEAQQQLKFSPCIQIALEALLLRILREQQRIPIEQLIKRLIEMESRLKASETASVPAINLKEPRNEATSDSPGQVKPIRDDTAPGKKDLARITSETAPFPQKKEPTPTPPPAPSELPKPPPENPVPQQPQKPSLPSEPVKSVSNEKLSLDLSKKEQARHETLMRFAAVELEGTLKKL